MSAKPHHERSDWWGCEPFDLQESLRSSWGLWGLALGPVFYYDLIRLARSPRNLYVRCGYLLALLIAWWMTFQYSQPLEGRLNDYARIATNFTYSLLALQYVAILVLAPIYLSGTILEERASRTLELMFQTHLTDREILLGKFAARVVHLMFLVLLSVPMLSIIALWGGIDYELLAMHLGLTLLTILLAGSISASLSVTSGGPIEALILSYLSEGTIGYILLIAGAVLLMPTNLGPVPPYWVQGLIVLPFFGAIWFFYRVALKGMSKLRDTNQRLRTLPQRIIQPKKLPRPPRRPTPARPVPDHALYWKETEGHRVDLELPDLLIWIGLIGVFAIGVGHLLGTRFLSNPLERANLHETAMALCALGWFGLAGLNIGMIGFRTAATVAREREGDTLEALWLLPVERSEILFIKWVAPIVRQRMTLFAMAAVPLLGMFSGVFDARAGMLLLLLPWPILFLVSSSALFFSVMCRRVIVANLMLIALGALIMGLHLFLGENLRFLVRSYFALLGDWRDAHHLFPGDQDRAILLIAGQQGLLLILAVFFFAEAFWQFSRKKRA